MMSYNAMEPHDMSKDKFRPVLSIIIPGINEAPKTVKCLQSIRAYTATPHEIVWVDNGSSPKQFAAIKYQATRPNVHTKLIRNSNNLGFVKAINQGLSEAVGEYIILLNNDTEVTPNWEKKLIKPLLTNPKVGAVGPVTQSRIAWQEAFNLNLRWNLSLPIFTTTTENYAEQLEKKFKDKYVDIGNLPLSFFCAAFRRSTFKDLGGLCEEFSIGLGDDDEYSMRLRGYGYRLMLSLGTFVYHHHRTTFKALHLGVDSLRRHNVKILQRKEREWRKQAEAQAP
jgi:GT2 family glycosyltransferase